MKKLLSPCRFALAFAALFLFGQAFFFGGVAKAQTYKTPPKVIADIIDAPPFPEVLVSPKGDAMLLVETKPNPSIELLAAPTLKLAGLRINPALGSSQRLTESGGLVVQRLTGGQKATTTRIRIPSGARIGSPAWSHDGSAVAFTLDGANGVELWTADAQTGAAKRAGKMFVSDIFGSPYRWLADKRLLVFSVPPSRGKAPEPSRVPAGPAVEESAGKMAQALTYQDLLRNSDDERIFEHFATTQLALVNPQSGAFEPVGPLGMNVSASVSPDGRYVLVTRLRKPFSYRVPYFSFAQTLEVWNIGQKPAKQQALIATLPIADETPRMGVPTGVRGAQWQALHPAKLLWVEALDGGDPMKKADFRDKIMTLEAPFYDAPREVAKVRHRFSGFDWTAEKDRVLVTEYDRERRWRTTRLVDFSKLGDVPADLSLAPAVFDLSVNDSYNNPGQPLYQRLPNGESVMLQDGDWAYLSGAGASETGERPFLDKMNIKTLEKKRLYQCPEGVYEMIWGFVGGAREEILTRYESKTEYPNFFAVTLASGARRALTTFQDPAPQLTALNKRLVKYRRADGVPLSGTLYLPPNYQEGSGERLPLIIVAYPLEYNDAATAGQVRGSPHRFTMRARSYSQIYLTLLGYAVLDGATMPIVGNPETMNDTFVEQITAASKAAIEYLDSLGVIDPKRVGVSGHSYGAFMTANLLAHTDLFAAGIAGSGAYNRTLTPFGFQGERRSFWEAPETYMKMSPFAYAHKIKKPLLMFHGEVDNNPGTFPIQSQRLYQAISGTGGIVKLVMLPHESHGYLARESVLHVMAEMVEWADKHIKNISPK